MICLTVEIPPRANVYWRYERGHVHVSKEAREYREQIGWLCREIHLEPLAGDLKLTMRIWAADKRRDLDGFQKVLFDALQHGAYKNDSQIKEAHIYLGVDKDNPRVDLEIEQL